MLSKSLYFVSSSTSLIENLHQENHLEIIARILKYWYMHNCNGFLKCTVIYYHLNYENCHNNDNCLNAFNLNYRTARLCICKSAMYGIYCYSFVAIHLFLKLRTVSYSGFLLLSNNTKCFGIVM